MAIYPLGVIGPWQIVIILFIVLLLFGGRKIPELRSGLGKGIKNFKSGLNEIDDQTNQAEQTPKQDPAKKEGDDAAEK